MDQHKNSLKPGYKLHWYQIREILGQGGFGITYLAQDDNLNQPVAIKEYLPVVLAVREGEASVHPVSREHGDQFQWGLERFINEAQTLARFRHPHIVRVLTVFKENNTAYMVMEYEQGRPLHEILKDKKFHTEQELKNIILPILDGLDQVHAENFIHRDIKPANIYIRTDGSPVLLDFGSARQSLGEQTQTLTTMISPGYAPFEQYVSNSRKQGPWTDIYGLGATLYRAITGIAPPDSMDRSEALLHTSRDIFVSAREIAAGRYSDEFLAAIDHAMAFRPEDRPQTIAAWRKELDSVPPVRTLNVRQKDEVITMPIIATGREIDTFQSAATLKIDRPATKPGEEKHQSEIPVKEEEPIDRAYGIIKKLLKWLLVLFIILVVALVLSRRKSDDAGPEGTLTPPVADQGVAEPLPAPGADVSLSEAEKLLAAARDDMAANRLTSPAGNNALEKYRKVLELEPRNKVAAEGLDTIASRYLRLVDQALDARKVRQAENYLEKAVSVAPSHPGIPAARLRLKVVNIEQSLAAPTAPLSRTTETLTSPAAVTETSPATASGAVEEEAEEIAPAKNNAVEESPDQEDADEEESVPLPSSPPESQVPAEERAKLQLLKDRLRQDPNDQAARQELKTLSVQFEDDIQEAIDTGDYALAKDYIREIQSVTPRYSRAGRKLNALMRVVEEKEARAAR